MSKIGVNPIGVGIGVVTRYSVIIPMKSITEYTVTNDNDSNNSVWVGWTEHSTGTTGYTSLDDKFDKSLTIYSNNGRLYGKSTITNENWWASKDWVSNFSDLGFDSIRASKTSILQYDF